MENDMIKTSTVCYVNEISTFYSFLLKYGIILILVPAIFTGFFSGKIVIVQTFCFGLYTCLLFVSKKNIQQCASFDANPFWLFYFVYCIITYIRGFFNIDSAQDWINLASELFFTSFLVPFIIFLSTPTSIITIWKSFLSWGFLLCAVCYFYPPSDGMMGFQHNISFINVFILCLPFIRRTHKLIIVIAVVIAISYDLDRRSILINNIIPFIILFCFPFLKLRLVRMFVITAFIISPIILLCLGLSETFNIFKYTESTFETQLEQGSRNITTDSRTGIYEDVFDEIDRKKAYIWGLGGNGKTPTSLVESLLFDYDETYKFGRPSTESGMLNHIQYGGLIGFLAYSFLLIVAAFKASNSNNDLMRMLGIFIAFKFLYSFIEDPISANAKTFYLFLWIGMCYNQEFRRMNNKQIKIYLNTIFNFSNGNKGLYNKRIKTRLP